MQFEKIFTKQIATEMLSSISKISCLYKNQLVPGFPKMKIKQGQLVLLVINFFRRSFFILANYFAVPVD